MIGNSTQLLIKLSLVIKTSFTKYKLQLREARVEQTKEIGPCGIGTRISRCNTWVPQNSLYLVWNAKATVAHGKTFLPWNWTGNVFRVNTKTFVYFVCTSAKHRPNKVVHVKWPGAQMCQDAGAYFFNSIDRPFYSFDAKLSLTNSLFLWNFKY